MGRLARGSDYGSCTQCVRFTFIGCNIFFAVLSLLGFIIGIWALATADTQYGTTNSTAGGAILLVSSLISFGLCAAGIVGGIFMLRPFLIVYAAVLAIVLILEFASAIVSFAFADAAREALDDYFSDSIRDYRFSEDDEGYDRDINDQVNTIQKGLKCCGVSDFNDWNRLNYPAVLENDNVPPANCSCDENRDNNCVVFTVNGTVVVGDKFVWEDGCLDILDIIVRAYYIVIGVISLIIMLIEILFVVVAVGLTVSITRAIKAGGFV
jgi:hypothetical protein